MLQESTDLPKYVIRTAKVWKSGRQRGIVKINTFGTAQKIRKQNNTKEM